MPTRKNIPTEKLEQVNQQLGSELCHALEWLTEKLKYGFAPIGRRGESLRDYARLREAKSLLAYLKYPGATAPVHRDDLAWALATIKQLYLADSHDEEVALLDQAADILGIDLSRTYAMPADLSRKINNEMQLMQPANLELAVAV